MFSIKSSRFSNCFNCQWLDAPSCILETNCPDNLNKIDLIIVAECPAKNEIKEGRPLVGRSGKTFRKYFEKYLKNRCNYLITNVVLCEVTDKDGKTANPDDETINRCKHNLLNIIDICKPKLIFCLGLSPLKAFINTKKIKATSDRGKVFRWNNHDILFTLHPSYLNRNMKNTDLWEKFEGDFITALELLGIKKRSELDQYEVNKSKGIQSYKIPDKYYSNDYRLIDVQYLYNHKELKYIFRDKNNKKVFYNMNDDYYCYQCLDTNVENRFVVNYDKLNVMNVKYENTKNMTSNITYEGDIRIEDKHIIDYFINNKKENEDPNLNILYMDIEVDTDGSKLFPKPQDADFPITLNTIKYHDKIITYILNNGSEIRDIKNLEVELNEKEKTRTIEYDNIELKIFNEEKDLILSFISDIHKLDPDIITGWNVINFDLFYIYTRMKKLGLDPNTMSRFGNVYVDGDKDIANLPGYVVIDMCALYKNLQLKKRPNNKLGTITKIEIGASKLELGGPLSIMYKTDINKFIEYNIRDVVLLDILENKIKFIKLLNELRKICSGSFRSCRNTYGRLDCLVIKYLKEKGLASRNISSSTKEKFKGAFVQSPLKGIHSYITDFDFASLYPSLILTYNVGVNTFVMKLKESHFGYDLSYNPELLPDEIQVILDPLFKGEEVTLTKEQLFNEIKEKKLIHTINGCFFKPHDEELSLYSELEEYLLNTRKQYKNKMFEAIEKKDSENADLFDIRQSTYKILANALYGILGTESYRFYNIDLTKSITLPGQENTKTSIVHVEKYLENMKDNNENHPEIIISKKDMFAESMTTKLKYIITGDTDSIFATFKKFIPKDWDQETAFKQIKIWCDEIGNYLNGEVTPRMTDKHNVPRDKNRLKIKNELMCDKGLFVAKKRYAIFVVYQEGKRVDEYVIKGLEIKRRDYSEYTKKCMEELINLILKSNKISFKLISSFIKEKENNFIDLINKGDKTIAKSVMFGRKLEEYKAHNKKDRDYPENIMAMQNWNMLMYETFIYGAGGYLFKINGVNPETAPKEIIQRYNKYFLETGRKLNVICLPDEEARLPEYFIINKKEMLKFSWIDRYTQLLDPILKMDKKIATL